VYISTCDEYAGVGFNFGGMAWAREEENHYISEFKSLPKIIMDTCHGIVDDRKHSILRLENL
jgi:hypothetical protein